MDSNLDRRRFIAAISTLILPKIEIKTDLVIPKPEDFMYGQVSQKLNY
jgi:hypothetical protein